MIKLIIKMPPKRLKEKDPDFNALDAEQNLDDDEDDDLFDEDEEETEEEEESPPKRIITKKVDAVNANRPRRSGDVKKAESKFVAFRSPKREGIMDRETNEPMAESMWEALADIYNKLEDIHDAIGKI